MKCVNWFKPFNFNILKSASTTRKFGSEKTYFITPNSHAYTILVYLSSLYTDFLSNVSVIFLMQLKNFHNRSYMRVEGVVYGLRRYMRLYFNCIYIKLRKCQLLISNIAWNSRAEIFEFFLVILFHTFCLYTYSWNLYFNREQGSVAQFSSFKVSV